MDANDVKSTIPFEFDFQYYQKENADLRELKYNDAYAHFQLHGISEGRAGSPFCCRDMFLASLDVAASTLVVEGPEYLNIRPDRSLTLTNEYPPDWRFTRLTRLAALNKTFDQIVSVNLLQYEPNPIGHLEYISAGLREGGRYFVVLGDKRYSDDFFFTECDSAEAVAAYLERRLNPPLKARLDWHFLQTHNDPILHWSERHGVPRYNGGFERTCFYNVFEEMTVGANLSLKCWHLTPSIFVELIRASSKLGLCDLSIEKIYNTPRFSQEFCAILTKKSKQSGSVSVKCVNYGAILDITNTPEISSMSGYLAETTLPPHVGSVSFSSTYTPNRLTIFNIRDAVVYGKYFPVLTEGRYVRETGHLAPPDLVRSAIADIELSDPPPLRLRQAVLGSNAAPQNHYHWIVECLFSAFLARTLQETRDLPLITGPLSSIQSIMLDRVGIPKDQHITLQPLDWGVVDELKYPCPLYGAMAFAPHPLLREMFQELKGGCVDSNYGLGKLIYISRGDSRQRVMVNEAELETMLIALGFAVVVPSSLSLDQQIAIFDQAEVIVAPHGAALTNLGFCKAGTLIYELIPEFYLNACFCRIAQVSSLRYLADIFVEVLPAIDSSIIHDRKWTVDIQRVADRLFSWGIIPTARP